MLRPASAAPGFHLHDECDRRTRRGVAGGAYGDRRVARPVRRPAQPAGPGLRRDARRVPRLARVASETLAAFAALREVERGNGDLVAVFRALRHMPRALEALYPLSSQFPPVSSFFLNGARREDENRLARLETAAGEQTGIFHDHNEPGSRGG